VGYELSTGWVLLVGFVLIGVALLAWRLLPGELPTPKNGTAWLGLLLLLGCLLRIGWVALVPPVQLSDMLDYVLGARELLAGHGFHTVVGPHKLVAIRPPGESLLLVAAMVPFGDHAWTPAILNLPAYVGTALILQDLVRRLAGEGPAIFANLLLAIWPTQIMLSGLALTETPSMLLWLATLWAVEQGQHDERLR
jgi:4-amino-4-deoxy-L-arabinose transferase-like glycosyltransferase